METRLGKYKSRRRNMYFSFLKLNIILAMIVVMGNFLFYVNNTIIELNCLDNTQLLNVDIENRILNLFGNSYQINLEYFKGLLLRK